MKLILAIGPALVIVSFPGVGRAQPLHVPPVEIAGQFGLIGAIAEGIYLRPIVGPRLSFNITQQHAIELIAETLVPNDGPGIYGLYFFQYKHTTRRPTDWGGIRPFVTAGTGGYYSYRKVPERRSSRPDGSVVVYYARSDGELSRLNIAAFGGGFERDLNRYASFRLEGSGFAVIDSEGYLGFRVLAGISVPIGGYRDSPIQ